MRRDRNEFIRDSRQFCRYINSEYIINYIIIEQVSENNSRDIGAIDTISNKNIITNQILSQNSKR